MKKSSESSFFQVAFTHFVPCFFLGLISLFFIRAFAPGMDFSALVDNTISFADIMAGTINGLLVGLIVFLFHTLRNHQREKGTRPLYTMADTRKLVHAAIVGFLGGSIDVLFGFHDGGILILTSMVLIILIWHLRVFAADVVEILKPDNHATWSEVSELFRIYLTMLAGFTLLNATLEVGHRLAGTPVPFGFGQVEGELFLNSLYYTVVTMTTLGYGDIVPQTWDAKLLLIFQCLASYVMFALMIGIVTRGVAKFKNNTE